MPVHLYDIFCYFRVWPHFRIFLCAVFLFFHLLLRRKLAAFSSRITKCHDRWVTTKENSVKITLFFFPASVFLPQKHVLLAFPLSSGFLDIYPSTYCHTQARLLHFAIHYGSRIYQRKRARTKHVAEKVNFNDPPFPFSLLSLSFFIRIAFRAARDLSEIAGSTIFVWGRRSYGIHIASPSSRCNRASNRTFSFFTFIINNSCER